MNIGNYLRNALLNECLGGSAFAPSATLEIRLFSTALTAAGAGTEINNPGYAPKTINNDTTNFPVSSTGTKENAVQFDFDPAEEDWDDVLAIGLFDPSGNLYFYQNYSDPIEVLDTLYFYLAIGDISISFS